MATATKPCGTCKGTGTYNLPVTTHGVGTEIIPIKCPQCDGMGELTPARAEALRREDAMWCGCGKSDEAPVFYADGQHRGCVHKHHWHCGNCRKISQVG